MARNKVVPYDDFDANLVGLDNPFGSKAFQESLDKKLLSLKSQYNNEHIPMNQLLQDIAIISKKASHQGTAPDAAKILADSAHVLAVTFSILKEVEFMERQTLLPGELPTKKVPN